jgi:hypothetical protein
VRDAVIADVHRRQPGIGLRHAVGAGALGVRPGLAEAGYRHIDHARIDFLHIRIRQAKPRHHAGAKTLQHHIGLARQFHGAGVVRRVLQVQHQAALAAVIGGAHDRHAITAMTQPARPVALRRFHLHHVGAVQRQHHAGMRAGDALAEIEYFQAIIGSHAGILRLP